MSNASKTGISSVHGDCPENAVLSSLVQAKSSCQFPKNEAKQASSISFKNQKLDFHEKIVREDKYSQGDHAAIAQPDQAKKNYDNPCLCCRRQTKSLADKTRLPTRIIYWEIPRPKFEGISVTADDYKPHKFPKREMPKWHPHRSQPWKRLDVPSVTITTYRHEFTPPVHGLGTRRLSLRPRMDNMQLQ